MLRPDSTSDQRPQRHLGIGFALILMLMLSLVLVALTHMAAVHQHLEDIVARHLVKGNLAWRMNLALLERRVSMHAATVMTDPFEQLDELDRMRAHGAQFLAERQQLETFALSAEESTLLRRIRDQAAKTRPLTEQVAEEVLAGQYRRARTSIRTQVLPQQAALVQTITRFIALQQREIERAVAQAAQSYLMARRLMLIFSGLALGLSVLIGVLTMRAVARRARTLQRQALHDALTDLPNRTLFDDRLRQAILVGQRAQRSFGLIVMDIDGFKQINDRFGHAVGDLVLQHVARCMRGCLRESDTLARMGGDEFTLLLATAEQEADVIAAAKKILQTLRTPCRIAEHHFTIEASLGIAMFSQQGQSVEGLMRAADAAMYAAKHARSGYCVYSAGITHPGEHPPGVHPPGDPPPGGALLENTAA